MNLRSSWKIVRSLVQPRDPHPDPVRPSGVFVEVPLLAEGRERGAGQLRRRGIMTWFGRKKTQLMMVCQRNAAVIMVIGVLLGLVLYLLIEIKARERQQALPNMNVSQLISMYGDKLGLEQLSWDQAEGLDIAMGLGQQKLGPDVMIHHIPPAFYHKAPSDKYINYMDIRHPPFVPDYKTPCWAEEMPYYSPYHQGYFYNNPPSQDMDLEGMDKRWQERLESGKDHRIRCLPYFYIIGFPNAGTMDLYKALHLHPEIVEISGKATDWWSKHRVGESSEGFVPIGNFIDLFDEKVHVLENHTVPGEYEPFHPYVIGDASPNTVWYNDHWKDLPENEGMDELDEPRLHVGNYLRHIQPHVYLIMILRNPVKRLYSDYGGGDPDQFHEAVKKGIQLMDECLEVKSAWSCVNNADLNKQIGISLRLGMYYVYAAEWMKIFHRDNLYIMRFEDLVHNTTTELTNVFRFLRLDPLTEEQEQKLGSIQFEHGDHEFTGQYMKDETRDLLQKFYESGNKKLNSILYTKDKYLWSADS